MGLRGEWWFEDGQAVFADGAAGDINHEGYALDGIKRQLLDALGVDMGSYDYAPELSEVNEEILQNIQDELRPEEIEQWQKGTMADVEKILEKYFHRKGDHDDLERLKYIMSPSLDAREYALKYWGWQRVKGRVIETWTLTPEDLRNIINGLDDAYGEEMEEDQTFNIAVLKTESWYRDVPLAVLETKDPAALYQYGQRVNRDLGGTFQ